MATENKTKIEFILNHIQSKINVPKNRLNTFANFRYRSLDDIYEALKPLLKEYGATLKLDDEMQMVGTHVYVKATATLSSVLSSGKITATATAREALQAKGKDASQMTGTASSYARKYALSGLLLLDDVKDPDTDEDYMKTGRSNNYKKQVKTPPELLVTSNGEDDPFI
tara:strand:- start:8964 stop:9470 length:507 start_codon:yes stop_codon:yes gene_type:complete